jgi:hypothetical protein
VPKFRITALPHLKSRPQRRNPSPSHHHHHICPDHAHKKDKMKFLKVGRVAIITRGRYAGKKVRF